MSWYPLFRIQVSPIGRDTCMQQFWPSLPWRQLFVIAVIGSGLSELDLDSDLLSVEQFTGKLWGYPAHQGGPKQVRWVVLCNNINPFATDILDAFKYFDTECIFPLVFNTSFVLAGEVVNLLSVDCQKLQDAALFVNFMWASPLQVGLAIFFLYQTIGWSVFVGKR